MASGSRGKLDADGRVLKVPGGTLLFDEGSAGYNMYLVREGVVEIFHDLPGGPQVIGTLTAGEFFGEMALIDRSPRMASARAKTDVVLVTISKLEFERRLANSDPFIRAVLRVLNRSYRKLAREKHNR